MDMTEHTYQCSDQIIKELSTNTPTPLSHFLKDLCKFIELSKNCSFKGTFQGKCLKFILSIAAIFLQEFQVVPYFDILFLELTRLRLWKKFSMSYNIASSIWA